ncbi:MAG: response regulator [Nitrospirae bacterium]|nr:response regulator [Nitrospirota bacterium]
MTDRPIHILLVEDNPDHAMMTTRALKKGKLNNSLHWVKDGQEALDYLFHQDAYADAAKAPTPGLVLLDLNLPKHSGFEVLERIKQDPILKTTPVIMLTTSGRDEEVNKCYTLGANSFITKPVEYEDFQKVVQKLECYWLLMGRLPNANAATGTEPS